MGVGPTPSITDVELFEPKHYNPSFLSGGRGGGTRFRLLGNDLLNPDGSFDASVSVMLGGQRAFLIPFLSTATQLVIETPAKPASSSDCCHQFKVRCSVHTEVDCHFKSVCGLIELAVSWHHALLSQVMNRNGEIENKIPSTKTFKYDDNATPYLHGVVPSAASPGDTIRILGSFPWWRLRMDSYPPADPRTLVRSAYIGPFRCDYCHMISTLGPR